VLNLQPSENSFGWENKLVIFGKIVELLRPKLQKKSDAKGLQDIAWSLHLLEAKYQAHPRHAS
jgi:hypothetical protein